MMRNTTATKSSTPLMTITSPTPFRQGRPLTGKRELELRAQHPSGTPEWDSLSDWRQRLASPSGADQLEKPPAGELSSLSPSGSRGGPAGASAPASTSSTRGGGEELNGLAGADLPGGGASPGTPDDGVAGGAVAAGGGPEVGGAEVGGAEAGGPAVGGGGGLLGAGGIAPEPAAGRLGATPPLLASRSRSWPSR